MFKIFYIIFTGFFSVLLFQYVNFDQLIVSRLSDIIALVVFSFSMVIILFTKRKKSFSIVFNILLIGFVLSSISSYLFWGQSIILSALIFIPTAYLAIYYNLSYLRLKQANVINIIHFFAILHLIIFILNYLTYPNYYFGMRVTENYGTIRSTFPGRTFMYASFFLYFYSFLKGKKLHILLVLLYALVFILMARRVMLASLIVSSLFLYIKYNRLKLKAIIQIVSITVAAYFLIMYFYVDLVMNLSKATEEQLSLGSEYIRFVAAKFYLTEFTDNIFCMIFGNGAPSMQSSYGQNIFNIRDTRNLHLADLGILGFYFKYGIIGASSIVIMFYKFWKSNGKLEIFFKAFTLFFIPMSFMNVEIIRIDSFFVYGLLMYLWDIDKSLPTRQKK